MAIRPWASRMRAEVEQLPDTLAALRASSASIAQVSDDLTVVSARLRQITEALDAAGLAEATEALTQSATAVRASMQLADDANRALADGVAKLPGGELLAPWMRSNRRS